MWAYSLDVARTALRALERGRCGARYLAVGRNWDVMSLPDLCIRAAAIAGLPARVENDTDGAPGRYGSMSATVPDKWESDSARTSQELGLAPTPVDDALTATVRWLREAGKIPA
jgi:nucleoside-diphosphate-sugar epimerase